jgi:plastocyanin
MKNRFALFVVAGLAVVVQAATAGNIIGTITLKGTPPPEVANTLLKDDVTCGKSHTTMPTTHHFVVGPNKELANVVVSLKGVGGKSTGASAPPAVLDQNGCEYVPSILAVQTGQKILAKNSDPVMHNVHVNPTVAANNQPINSAAQMQGAADLTIVFKQPENFLKFQCDVHPWMFAWVSVFDHPYFSVSGKDGTFKIANVPPGKYTIVAMHRKAAPAGVEKEIEVKDGDVTVDFTLEVK